MNPVLPKAPRMDNFVSDTAMGPGVYEVHDHFGTGCKNFTIPPSPGKSQERIGHDPLGPGHYDPERADAQIRPYTGQINFGQ